MIAIEEFMPYAIRSSMKASEQHTIVKRGFNATQQYQLRTEVSRHIRVMYRHLLQAAQQPMQTSRFPNAAMMRTTATNCHNQQMPNWPWIGMFKEQAGGAKHGYSSHLPGLQSLSK